MAMNPHKAAALERGRRAELIVAQLYEQAGFTIVARNWRCFEGELDIVARSGRTVVVCEVKARSPNRHRDPALAISPAKQVRVRTAAYRWLEQQRVRARLRFDVALVVADRVQLIEGAF